ncbi:MAG: threonylcarbamoyl-AMP synthase [Victivallaceae bacterium]|nr:threonylcarbamoyl-AMP synthase [Victivallaceae bacterium]
MNSNCKNNLAPAIFLDRDGTLIEDRGYLKNSDEVIFYPDTVQALIELQKKFKLFIVTNQQGIAEGILMRTEVDRVNDYVVEYLRQAGVEIVDTYVCPHRRPDNCACIKPKPLFLQQAAAEYNIDLYNSFAIGDHPHDVEFAWNGGLCGIYVMTGHGRRHLDKLHRDALIATDVADAAWLIINSQTTINDYAVERAATIIREGGIVAFPTETVYGLGADAFNVSAVEKIFVAKQRPYFDPLIVHIARMSQLDELIVAFPPAAKILAEVFWPGPLTLILPKSDKVPDIITAGLNTVAVRIPAHGTALRLLNAVATPVAAPSANKFGQISPTTVEHVLAQLRHDIDLTLNSDIPCEVGVESTIISFATGSPVLLRSGGISLEQIEPLIGKVTVKSAIDSDIDKSVVEAPGMLTKHYAPQTPLIYGSHHLPGDKKLRIGRLAFSQVDDSDNYAVVKVLSPSGNLEEAAQNLYAAMCELDDLGVELIIVDDIPVEGIGVAINDRLKRASSTV